MTCRTVLNARNKI